jgi:hypothetical protein
LKQATLILALLGAIVLAGCSSNSDTTSQTSYNNGSGNQPFKPKTHLNHRAIVSNYYAGALDVMDTTQDRLTAFSFPVGSEPTYLQLSPDATLTFVNNTASNSISTFDNFQETVRATIQLGGWTQSFVTSKSNEFGFAAVYNVSNGNPPSLPGGIVGFNPTDGNLNPEIQFPYVRYLAMDTAEQHLLAFTQDAPVVTVNGVTVTQDDTANWVDLTTNDPATGVPPYYTLSLSTAGGSAVQLSRPVAAFFSADNTKAYILSCGYECGGSSSASVTEINTASITPVTPLATGTLATATVVNQWAVNGARIGMIDTTANKLYVAGSNATLIDQGGNNVQNGYFTVIDLTTGPTGTAIPIGNGVKRWIRNINGVYWIASLNCGVESCVTLVNPAARTAAELANAYGDATGISLAVNSGEVYTIEGGELYIYTQKGTQIIPQYYNTDIHGQGSDVLYID